MTGHFVRVQWSNISGQSRDNFKINKIRLNTVVFGFNKWNKLNTIFGINK